MTRSVNINIRMDEKLKKQAEAIFSELGMTTTTAFTIFAKAVVREKKIPFTITADPADFYKPEGDTKKTQSGTKPRGKGSFKKALKELKELEQLLGDLEDLV